MAFLYQVGEELQDVGEQQQAYVHSVDIGIGGYDYFVVTQVVDAVLDVQGCAKKRKLIVLVDIDKRHSIGVERLASEREHGLGFNIAYLGD